uniref:Sulfate ABC transporter substrate-binding protein n=1 Tax=Olisthodiscus luteus TaxID=83000 RepID=A0A7U0LZ67_OLILU|nr:sulfate ABC transporter substrate-binding protein [Olisthodiscus luteus]
MHKMVYSHIKLHTIVFAVICTLVYIHTGQCFSLISGSNCSPLNYKKLHPPTQTDVAPQEASNILLHKDPHLSTTPFLESEAESVVQLDGGDRNGGFYGSGGGGHGGRGNSGGGSGGGGNDGSNDDSAYNNNDDPSPPNILLAALFPPLSSLDSDVERSTGQVHRWFQNKRKQLGRSTVVASTLSEQETYLKTATESIETEILEDVEAEVEAKASASVSEAQQQPEQEPELQKEKEKEQQQEEKKAAEEESDTNDISSTSTTTLSIPTPTATSTKATTPSATTTPTTTPTTTSTSTSSSTSTKATTNIPEITIVLVGFAVTKPAFDLIIPRFEQYVNDYVENRWHEQYTKHTTATATATNPIETTKKGGKVAKTAKNVQIETGNEEDGDGSSSAASASSSASSASSRRREEQARLREALKVVHDKPLLADSTTTTTTTTTATSTTKGEGGGEGGGGAGLLLRLSRSGSNALARLAETFPALRGHFFRYRAKVRVAQSFGPSGGQTRSVMEGLPADVVCLSLAADMDKLVSSGRVQKDWARRTPEGTEGTVARSATCLVVRPGNPKGVTGYGDLVRDDIDVIIANPMSAGVARWNFMALWAHTKAKKMDYEQARQFAERVYDRAPVWPRDGREASDVFFRIDQGDVLVSYENEALLAKKRAPQSIGPYTVPKENCLIECPISTIDYNGGKRSQVQRQLAREFVNFCYSDQGQRCFAEAGFRPVNPHIEAEYRDDFPPLARPPTNNIDDFGGWGKVQKEFFGIRCGSIFEQVHDNVAMLRRDRLMAQKAIEKEERLQHRQQRAEQWRELGRNVRKRIMPPPTAE